MLRQSLSTSCCSVRLPLYFLSTFQSFEFAIKTLQVFFYLFLTRSTIVRDLILPLCFSSTPLAILRSFHHRLLSEFELILPQPIPFDYLRQPAIIQVFFLQESSICYFFCCEIQQIIVLQDVLDKMSAKVDQESAVEPYKIKMSAKNTLSGASTSGSKASIFAAKSGFVIPKNKLSGSLIPIFRGGKKPGGNDAANDEITNQVIRKSKWGPDPTQDAAVRRGRALAYQTRIDQITQQLTSGILEPGDTQSSQVAEQPADSNLSAPLTDFKVSEMLKLERLEIIGEILKLNPSFKTPPDYEPLLKEATVSIPVQDHPGYDFVGLIFGPGSETQKQLEKETKAKIQVFGTKANTGEKVEISASNMGETQAAYEELNVHVSADTFEKVDEAVALIDLLVASVLENLAAGSNQSVLNQDHPFGERGVEQLVVGPVQTPVQGQFHFQGPGFPQNTAQASGHLFPGFNLIQNSAPIHSNSLPVHLSPLDPSFYGSQPISITGFSSTLPGTSFVHSRPQMLTQVSSYPYPPRNFHTPVPQPSSAQVNILTSLPMTASQPPLSLPVAAGPLMASLPLSGSGVLPGPPPDRRLSSSGWSAVPPSVSASLGPRPVIPQPGFMLSTPPSNMPPANAVSFSSGLSTMNHPTGALSFASVPAPQVGSSSTPQPIKSPGMVMAVSHAPINIVPGTLRNSPLLVTTASQLTGNTTNPTLLRPPIITASKSSHSGLGDFTFKLHHPLQYAAPNPRPINQSLHQDNAPLRQLMQTQSSQAPSFRMGAPNLIPSPGMHVFPRAQVGNQTGQNEAHWSGAPFAGTSITPRAPSFPNANPIIPPPVRNFSAAPRRPLPPMPGSHPLQNYPAPITPSASIFAPNQQPSTNRVFASNTGPGGGQIYDPFSPT